MSSSCSGYATRCWPVASRWPPLTYASPPVRSVIAPASWALLPWWPTRSSAVRRWTPRSTDFPTLSAQSRTERDAEEIGGRRSAVSDAELTQRSLQRRCAGQDADDRAGGQQRDAYQRGSDDHCGQARSAEQVRQHRHQCTRG